MRPDFYVKKASRRRHYHCCPLRLFRVYHLAVSRWARMFRRDVNTDRPIYSKIATSQVLVEADLKIPLKLLWFIACCRFLTSVINNAHVWCVVDSVTNISTNYCATNPAYELPWRMTRWWLTCLVSNWSHERPHVRTRSKRFWVVE